MNQKNSIKRKLNSEEVQWMSRDYAKYRRVTKNKWQRMLFCYDYEILLLQLVSKTDKDISFDTMKCRLKKTQKRAIDYVGIWDARTVKEALKWLAAHHEEDCRRSFVQLVLKEQPEKNFFEALERVCKAWDKIRNVYTYKELFNDDAKSDKIKLEYCDWLGTDIKERDVMLYKYWDLVDWLEENLSSHLVSRLEFMLWSESSLFRAEHAIDYVGIWDAKTTEEALNWIVVVGNRYFARHFVELVFVEQPETNFWEALERVCKAWNDIRKVYTYEELNNVENDNDKNVKVKLHYCDWLKA